MRFGIAVMGANGSGKTTLGESLARALAYKHMDIEEYSFLPSDIPYARPRQREETRALLLADMTRCGGRFVFSAVHCDLGAQMNALYACAVYIEAPPDVRLVRIKQRSARKFGNRVLAGGDMYEQEMRFYDFVASRPADAAPAWLQTAGIPVICLDGERPIAENTALILSKLSGIL